MLVTDRQLFSKSCENHSGHQVCRSRGGESCALDGALIVLQPVSDAAHIVHAPITCCGYSWDGRGSASDKGPHLKKGFTTDMDEFDIIYGSIDKLKKAIKHVIEKYRPEGVFVYSSCISGLIGEDIESACRLLSEETGVIVVPVTAPGFIGPKNLGNRIAGDALTKYVIGTLEPGYTTDYDVNIVGEYNVASDLDHIEPILSKVGLRILARITGNARFREIRQAHRAKLNLIFCGRALVNLAEDMKKNYGTDYVDVSFFGPTLQ